MDSRRPRGVLGLDKTIEAMEDAAMEFRSQAMESAVWWLVDLKQTALRLMQEEDELRKKHGET